MTGCVRGYCFSVIENLLLFVNHVALYIDMYHHLILIALVIGSSRVFILWSQDFGFYILLGSRCSGVGVPLYNPQLYPEPK